jgi:hypothetical protein
MRRLETVTVPIQRDYDSAYDLLSDPRNYPKWSPIPDGQFEQIDDAGYEWQVELPRGLRIMRFARPNAFGVLDYDVVSASGEHEYTARLRLIRNDDGCTLIAHYLQRPGTSDDVFASEVEWAANDLRAVGVVVEAL